MFTTRTKNSLLVFAVLLVMTLLSISCMKEKSQEPMGVDDAWRRAKTLFEKERYTKAQQVLRDIILNYSGSAIIDSAEFYLARTMFEIGTDYLSAADEFHKLQEQYPSSPLGGASQYWEARSYYEQSPSYQLDQTFTNKALQGFQRYLEEHPREALTDSGYYYLGRCRDKLAHKEYAAANLYFDLGEFASAISYADVVLANYYDTDWAGPAQFTKGRSYFELADWTRSKKELQIYLDKYPAGKFVVRARAMLAGAERSEKPASVAKP